jgi:hypothetical protein
VAGSLTSQQTALLEMQKEMNLQMETFQTFSEIESSKEKAHQSAHDAVLAAIEGMRGS